MSTHRPSSTLPTGIATLVAFGAGAACWILVSVAQGGGEAWDGPLYFPLVPLALAGVCGVLGALSPGHAWRLAMATAAGQFAVMLVTKGFGNLLPLGMAFLAILALPAVLAARFGARIGARRLA